MNGRLGVGAARARGTGLRIKHELNLEEGDNDLFYPSGAIFLIDPEQGISVGVMRHIRIEIDRLLNGNSLFRQSRLTGACRKGNNDDGQGGQTVSVHVEFPNINASKVRVATDYLRDHCASPSEQRG